jgi:hypothetical protein
MTNIMMQIEAYSHEKSSYVINNTIGKSEKPRRYKFTE